MHMTGRGRADDIGPSGGHDTTLVRATGGATLGGLSEIGVSINSTFHPNKLEELLRFLCRKVRSPFTLAIQSTSIDPESLVATAASTSFLIVLLRFEDWLPASPSGVFQNTPGGVWQIRQCARRLATAAATLAASGAPPQ